MDDKLSILIQELMPGQRDVGWSDTPAWMEPKPANKMAIHLIDLRTRQVSTLPDSEGLYSPRWSPDAAKEISKYG